MSYLAIENIEKRFGAYTALDKVSFSIPRGEIVTLLGPSGCGKTTLLRTIAGLEGLDDGRITLDGRVLVDAGKNIAIPPERRGIGMVFQSYALWPHMTVGDNIALGLRMKRVGAAKIAAKTADVLAMVGLPGIEKRFPSSLSGGQQQRVSLARALALEPACILFDEPLSNLDVLLRDRMRFEIRELLKAQGMTAIYVTHDQSEAMVISDVVLIMQHGRLIQAGAPKELYAKPKTRFVAEFFGRTNILPIDPARSQGGMVATSNGLTFACTPGLTPRQGDLLGFRPENVAVVPAADDAQMSGVVTRAVYLGSGTQIDATIAGVNVTSMVTGPSTFEAGAAISLRVAPEHLMVLEGDAAHE